MRQSLAFCSFCCLASQSNGSSSLLCDSAKYNAISTDVPTMIVIINGVQVIVQLVVVGFISFLLYVATRSYGELGNPEGLAGMPRAASLLNGLPRVSHYCFRCFLGSFLMIWSPHAVAVTLKSPRLQSLRNALNISGLPPIA